MLYGNIQACLDQIHSLNLRWVFGLRSLEVSWRLSRDASLAELLSEKQESLLVFVSCHYFKWSETDL